MKSLRHMWFIAMKDLKIFSRDRQALIFAILFPFLFVVLFSFALSGVGSEDERLELHLVTQEDRNGLSHDIIEDIETEDESELELEPGEAIIVWDDDYEIARRAVADRELAGFVAFPEDFTEGVTIGYGTNLKVVVDPGATYDRAALNSMAEAIASSVGMQHIVSEAISELLLEQWLESPSDMVHISREIPEFLSAQGSVPMRESLIEYEVEKVGVVEAEEPSNFVIPGYLVMFVFFTAALSAENIVRERQNNTLERMLANSVSRMSILGGIFIGTSFKGLIQITIFWVVGILVFNLDLGLAPAGAIVLSILMIIMSSAFGLMLATLVRTERSASSIATLTSLVLAPLGGCWWPLFITPRWMQFMAKLTPHGWATTGFNKLIVFGADFSAAVPEMLALIAFATVFGIIALWRFRASAV
jgi:ABC-2 type transport system permease protein